MVVVLLLIFLADADGKIGKEWGSGRSFAKAEVVYGKKVYKIRVEYA